MCDRDFITDRDPGDENDQRDQRSQEDKEWERLTELCALTEWLEADHAESVRRGE